MGKLNFLFIFTLSFIIPVLSLPLTSAVIVSMVWGLSVLGIFSFYIAKEQEVSPWKVVMEHVVIALIVIVITHYVGGLVSLIFE